jgi:hypothetical protein
MKAFLLAALAAASVVAQTFFSATDFRAAPQGRLTMACTLAPQGVASRQIQAASSEQKEKKTKPAERNQKQRGEGSSQPADLDRGIARLLRDLQFALEGGSAHGVLSLIDSAKFEDYRRFEDRIERLVRQNTIRAYFAQVSSEWLAQERKVRSVLEAELELARKDGASQVVRRRKQLVLELERGRRGWRITRLTPPAFFDPY